MDQQSYTVSETDATQNAPDQPRGNSVETTAPQTADTEPPCNIDFRALQDDIAERRRGLEARTVETFRKMRAMLG